MNDHVMDVLREIEAQIEDMEGHIGLYYQDLTDLSSFGIRENEPFLAASVIKLPVYLAILREAAAGRADLSERLLVQETDKLPISGALTLFTGELEADIQTLCNLMISLSDNTATNLLIRRFGMEKLNCCFREMGLKTTVLRRPLFDSERAERGLENTVSPIEMGMLLKQLFQKQFVNQAVSEAALRLLKLQQFNHKLGGWLSEEVPIAHKTGEDDGLTNDVGIIYAEKPFVLCILGHGVCVPALEDLMRRAANHLYSAHQ